MLLGNEILADRQLVVSVSGRNVSVRTSLEGTFEITGVALGPQNLIISFHDPDTNRLYKHECSVQVGIQGVTGLSIDLAVSPKTFDEVIQVAERQLALGQWEVARQHLDDLADSVADPQEAKALELAWGWFYLQSGESHVQAEAHFQRALTLGGGAEAQVGLAGVAAGLGQYEEAVSQLEQALAETPHLRLTYPDLNTGDLNVVLATWHIQTGDGNRAMDILRRQAGGASVAGQRVKDDLLMAFGG